MAALIIFATYRLGVAFFDDISGGVASLLLFLTTIFRWSETMRGTAVDFALIASGLALFIGARGSSVLFAFGALILGTAIPSHALDGALALGVAGSAVASWAIAGDWRKCGAGITAMLGAMLIAAPEFAIATLKIVPITLLIFALGSGVTLIILASTMFPATTRPEPAYLSMPAMVLLGCVVFAMTYESLAIGGLHAELRLNYPILSILALGGSFAMIAMPPAGKRSSLLIIAAALMPALIVEHWAALLPWLGSHGGGDFAKFDLVRKLVDYWLPFVMVFPAAWLLARLCERVSRTLVVIALLATLISPVGHRTDIDYYGHEHSISENWMIDYSIISNGYWTPTADSRWTLGPDQRAMLRVLENEITAGRVTTATHILHIVHDVSPDGTMFRFSVFTGIDDDPVVLEPTEAEWPIWLKGGRVRPARYLDQALARHPPYILSELPAKSGIVVPEGYDLISGGRLKLYRRHDLSRAHEPGR